MSENNNSPTQTGVISQTSPVAPSNRGPLLTTVPIEIRVEIYKHLIPDAGIFVGLHEPQSQTEPDCQATVFLKKRRGPCDRHTISSLDPSFETVIQPSEQCLACLRSEIRAGAQLFDPVPDRNSLEASPGASSGQDKSKIKEPSMNDLLSVMSTCKLLRKEATEVFWANTHVEVSLGYDRVSLESTQKQLREEAAELFCDSSSQCPRDSAVYDNLVDSPLALVRNVSLQETFRFRFLGGELGQGIRNLVIRLEGKDITPPSYEETKLGLGIDTQSWPTEEILRQCHLGDANLGQNFRRMLSFMPHISQCKIVTECLSLSLLFSYFEIKNHVLEGLKDKTQLSRLDFVGGKFKRLAAHWREELPGVNIGPGQFWIINPCYSSYWQAKNDYKRQELKIRRAEIAEEQNQLALPSTPPSIEELVQRLNARVARNNAPW